MKRVLVVVAAAALAACGSASLEEIEARFNDNPQPFTAVHEMLAEDTPDRQGEGGCFTIGINRIGERWQQGDDTWGSGNSTGTLDDALAEVDLSNARYFAYAATLNDVEATVATHCLRDNKTRVTVATSGLGISGCITTVEISDDPSEPGTYDVVPGSETIEVTELSDGWQMVHTCT